MRKEVDKKRQRLFQVLTLAFPVVFFILTEGGLRLFDYGRNLELFIPVEANYADAEYLRVNSAVAHRYFSQSTSTMPGKALPYLEKAVEELPNDTQILFNLGRAYMLGGQKDRAVEMLAQLKKIQPDFSGIAILNKMIDSK